MKKTIIMTLLTLLIATTSYATPLIFSGLDLGNGEEHSGFVPPLTSWPNSETAETQFFSNLNNIVTVDFEDSSPGDSSPTVNFGSGINATFSNLWDADGYIATLPFDDDGYPISGNNHWESLGPFMIDFSEEISAFGFYATDLGDVDTITYLKYMNTFTGAENVISLGPNNLDAGSVKYFGFYDLETTFNRIAIATVDAGQNVLLKYESDWYGIDNISVGTPIPEPTTMLLLGSGLIGLAGFRRKFRKS